MVQEMLAERPVVETNGKAASGKLISHYRALVQHIQAANLSAPANETIETVGIVSCAPGAGVSTIARNIAIAAAGTGIGRVLLIDADVTKPADRHLAVESPALGLADALSEAIDPMDCVIATRIHNLSMVAGRGSAKRDGSDFAPFKAAELVNEYRGVFKLVIVDIPAPSELNGSIYLAGQLDGVILVIESELSDSRQAVRMKQQLVDANANLLGAVLNKRRKHVPGWLDNLL